MNMEITGTLRNAVRVPRGDDVRAPCLKGQVYGDVRRRFFDGDVITTSTVLSEEGDVFTTRNSVYRVESWAVDENAAFLAGRRASHINALVSYFHAKSNAAGWWAEGGRDLTRDKYVHATKLMLVVTELAEAMEGLRKGLQDDKLPHRKMAEVELADACIRIFDLAGALGYDLGGAVVEKDAFNSVRPDHKPEARAAAGGKVY
jgi:hypothetical protein